MKKQDRYTGVPLAIRAEEALRRAVAKAIAERRMRGRSIAVWRDGKVTHIPADQIIIREVTAKYCAS
jgi:hypothetical protein